VAPGEQQSEAGHEYNYSSDSSTGDYNTEHYRDARANGYIQYTLFNNTGIEENLSIMLRFNLADRGRKATLTVDGTKLADITIPATAKGSDGNGFYNVEYPIPASLAKGKTQFVVRLTASSTTLCPGLYYLRLLKDYNDHAYQFVATDWTTGDAGRVSASNITYDTDKNIIHVKASGDNNVCLMLKYTEKDYTIASDQKMLVVRGTDLKTTTGMSYLWWLNGSNHGTQVAPVSTQTIAVDGINQTAIAWNMSTSGLYENFTGNRPNVCMGQTIFGLTSTTGQSDIHDISFVSNVSEYLQAVSGITEVTVPTSDAYYDLNGVKTKNPSKGVFLSKGKKAIF